ncbi:hypothetical protein Q9966_014379 [Columba livia]|nr:hypothetical protein Q9966_014379 [Columba livia]
MAQEQYLSSVLPQDHQAALESFKLVQLLMVMASYWKVQGWLEQMRQLKETEDQVSAAKRNILQAVTLALEEHDVQEEKIEGVDEAGAETLLGTSTYDVNKMIAQTFHAQGVDEAGAETLLGTFTYDVNKMIAQTFHAQSMWLAEDLPERDTLKELSLLMPPASPSEDPLPLKLA